jgi:hypothetical protein
LTVLTCILKGELYFPNGEPHGAVKVNDSFFYVSSWTETSFGYYSYANATWNFELLVNNTHGKGGSNMAIDECDRIWFLHHTFGLRVYNTTGSLLGSWNMGGNTSYYVYDILLLPNYVMMVTYWHGMKIVHYDPRLTCDCD